MNYTYKYIINNIDSIKWNKINYSPKQNKINNASPS